MDWMYRCANDLFGYCTGEPEWVEKPGGMELHNALGDRQVELIKVPLKGTCVREHEKCKRYRIFGQVVEKQTEAVNA